MESHQDNFQKVLSERYECASEKQIREYLKEHEIELLRRIFIHISVTCHIGRYDETQANMIIDGTRYLLNNVICKECGKNPQFFLALLNMIKHNTIVPKYLKYKSIEEFLHKYKEEFGNHDRIDQSNLFETANWMNVLFHFLPAKFNKGVILAAVTKCVEGFQANYITGKGQKSSVNDRVYIYEKEGNVQKLERNRVGKKMKSSDGALKAYRPKKILVQSTDLVKHFKRCKIIKNSLPSSFVQPQDSVNLKETPLKDRPIEQDSSEFNCLDDTLCSSKAKDQPCVYIFDAILELPVTDSTNVEKSDNKEASKNSFNIVQIKHCQCHDRKNMRDHQLVLIPMCQIGDLRDESVLLNQRCENHDKFSHLLEAVNILMHNSYYN